MRLNYHLLIVMSVMLVIVSCQPERDNSRQFSFVRNEVQNKVAQQLFSLMECQEGSYQRLQEKLGVYNPLFEYVDMGASSDFGPYYIIPYQDDNDSISGCIIYPVDEVLDDMEKRSFDGLLGNPIDFDSEYLQHEYQ